MDEQQLKTVSQQLRKPSGELGKQIGDKMNEGNRLINERAIAALQLEDHHQVLEIGMGNGFFVPQLLNTAQNIRYHGCDFSEIMVDEATKNNAAFIGKGQVQFHLTNGIALPFDAATFDRVLSINTIYFWERPTEQLDEIRRVLKKDGQLLLALRPKHQMRHYPFVHGFISYDETDIRQLLQQNLFEVLEIIETPEPDQEFEGKALKISSLLVRATKQSSAS